MWVWIYNDTHHFWKSFVVEIVANSTHNEELRALPNRSMAEPASRDIGRTLFDVVRFRVRNEHILSLFTNSNRLKVRTLSEKTTSYIFIRGGGDTGTIIRGGVLRYNLRSETGVCLDSTISCTSEDTACSVIFLSPPCRGGLISGILPLITTGVDSNKVVTYRATGSRTLPRSYTNFSITGRGGCKGVGLALCQGSTRR